MSRLSEQQLKILNKVEMPAPSPRSSVGRQSLKGQILAAKVVTKVMEDRNFAKEIIAIKKNTPLRWVTVEEIEANKEVFAQSLYLYWACFRGFVPLIKHILDKNQISPFARIYEGRSPLMASLIGKNRVQEVSQIKNNA